MSGSKTAVFPHSRSLNDAKELEEERRLAYVAITRAEKILYVTHSMRRRVYGEEMAAEPSQFLNEMPLELIEDLSLRFIVAVVCTRLDGDREPGRCGRITRRAFGSVQSA